ncbi:Glucoamylase GLU1 precursor [Scheffersomyces coipomensis]|uniref:Glucoamylase GLU1 precursor n=1 Tax=Scheffersomyces coipomensis TaxID=1788519 RepID=UPI00315DF94B
MKLSSSYLILSLTWISYSSALVIPNINDLVTAETTKSASSSISYYQSVLAGYLPSFFNQENVIELKSDENNDINTDFESWIHRQKDISFQGILNNIGGISSTLSESEVSEGAVIASPSRIKPDYFYQWTRDAALTIKSLIHHIDDEKFKNVEPVKNIIESYIENNYYIQRLDNLSGKFDDESKSGLGEPKFYPNNKPFEKNWGRPQRDGPGLRAITILSYISLLNKHQESFSNQFLNNQTSVYEEIIKPDLIYIIKNWYKEGFDLWEEINSHHFYTSITQLSALKSALIFIQENNYPESNEFLTQLNQTFNNLKQFIEFDSGYKSNTLPYIIETPSLLKLGKRCGLDAGTLLGVLHAHNIEFGNYDDIPFDIDNNYLINTLSAMIADMKYRYPINHPKIGFENAIGVALGRYPEDIYDGYGTSEGNPWFISTASGSEIIYKFIHKLISMKQDIVINQQNKEFFKQFIDFDKIPAQDLVSAKDSDSDSNANADVIIRFGSQSYKTLAINLSSFSDSFLEIVKDHVDNNGSMSEQFNKYHGFMQGARDLTWSYSAVWNAFRWREKTLQILESNF